MAGDVILNNATVTFENVELHFTQSVPPELMDRLGEILGATQSVREELSAMTPEMQRLTDEVAQTRGATDSILALVQGLAEQLRDNAEDPAAIRAMADSLDADQQRIAQAVAANPRPGTGGGTGGGGTGGTGGGTLGGTFADRASFDSAVGAYTGPEAVTVDGANVKGGTFPSLDYFSHSADGHVDRNPPTD